MIQSNRIPLSAGEEEKLVAWITSVEAIAMVRVIQCRMASLQAEASNAAVEATGGSGQVLTVDEKISEVRELQAFLKVLDTYGKKPELLAHYRLEIV